jgi:hypothetical protein
MTDKFKRILAEEMVNVAVEIGMNDVPTVDETIEYLDEEDMSHVIKSLDRTFERWSDLNREEEKDSPFEKDIIKD